jgi:glycine/D-amino acid oxidase-like deaminating enzyme
VRVEHCQEEVYQSLARRLCRLLPAATIERRWLGQVIETSDGMPYIGENADRQFIATGFAGNGMTLGTLAAMMARDRYFEAS